MDDTMISYNISTIPLFQLIAMKDKWRIYPSCQREKVWDTRRQQKYIDSMLRNVPVPPLAYFEENIPFLGMRYSLVDGQQRFESVCSYYANDFPTAKSFSTEEVRPLFSGLRYFQLPDEARAQLDNYHMPIVYMGNTEPDMVSITFRRWQGGMPLTFAEKLFSYDGVTKDAANKATLHKFWAGFYGGDIKRKQPFQISLKIMLMESYGVFSNLTTPRQVDVLVSKSRDWSGIPERIDNRLNIIMHLFDGSDVTSIGQVVMLYQLVMLLEECDYNLSSCDKGCLTKWFMACKADILDAQRNGAYDLFARFDKVGVQREFWGEKLNDIFTQVSKGKRDTKRRADTGQRIKLWVSQNGKCGYCGKDLRYKDCIVHHVEAHSNGGKTELDNLIAIHTQCSKNIHLGVDSEFNFSEKVSC